MNRHLITGLFICGAFFPWSLTGRTVLDFSGTEHRSRDTVYTFTFALTQHNSIMTMDLHSDLEQGTLTVWLSGGGYEVIGNYTDHGAFRYDNIQFGPLNRTEPINVRVTPRKALGTWSVRLTEHTSRTSLLSVFGSGLLIIIIALVFIIIWKMRCRSSLRWFFAGGLIWLAGIILKFMVAYFMNTPVLAGLDTILPRPWYLLSGSFYIGSLTGIFEMGVTLVFALTMRSLYADACRAGGVGIGAGTTEALLIGLSQIGSVVLVFSNVTGSTELLRGITAASLNTPLLALVAPVERLLVIPCHCASRMLVFHAVLRRKASSFWIAFALMTVIDMIAGYVHLAGMVNTISMWWIELLLVPFAILSVMIIRWCTENWNGTVIRREPSADHVD